MRKNKTTRPPRRIVREPNSELETRASAIYGFGSLIFCLTNDQGVQKHLHFPIDEMCELGNVCTRTYTDLKGKAMNICAKRYASIEKDEKIDIWETDASGIVFVAFDEQHPFAWTLFTFHDFLFCEYICKVFNCSFEEAIYNVYAMREEDKELHPLSSLPEGLTRESVKRIVKKYYPADNGK